MLSLEQTKGRSALGRPVVELGVAALDDRNLCEGPVVGFDVVTPDGNLCEGPVVGFVDVTPDGNLCEGPVVGFVDVTPDGNLCEGPVVGFVDVTPDGNLCEGPVVGFDIVGVVPDGDMFSELFALPNEIVLFEGLNSVR